MSDRLDKIIRAFGFLKADLSALAEKVSGLEKVRPIVREGKPGRDGVSPDVAEVVDKVLAQIPEPEKVDTRAIIEEVTAAVPKPRDGRDAPAVNVSDVAAVVLAKLPTPRDGKDGRDGKSPSVEAVAKKVTAGRQGDRGPVGQRGKQGKNGAGITDVKLQNNDLFVYIEGKKRLAGSINVPVPSAPFNPGGGGSMRGAGLDPNQLGWETLFDTEYPDQDNGLAVSADQWVRIPNNGTQLPASSNLPKGVTSFYNADEQKFNFDRVNSFFYLSIAFSIVPVAADAVVEVRSLIDAQPVPGNFFGPTKQPLVNNAGENSPQFIISTQIPVSENIFNNGIYYELRCTSDCVVFQTAYLVNKALQK